MRFFDNLFNAITTFSVRKRIIIFVSILLVVFIIPILIEGSNKNKHTNQTSIIGVFVEFENGENLFVNVDHIIRLNDNIVEGLSSGDGIRITIIDEIEETFPASAKIVRIEKLNEGSTKNIPSNIIKAFENLNYKIKED